MDFTFKIVGDRLLKEYPELKDYVKITDDYLHFSIIANSFEQSALSPLAVYASTSKFPKLCVEGHLDCIPSSFPSRIDYPNQLYKCPWDLNDTQRCYDDVYKEITKYIPMIKAAIEWYNTIDFTHVEDTLNTLGFNHESSLTWRLSVGNICLAIACPTVRSPYFGAIIRKSGQSYANWVRFSEFTIDELLNKIVEEGE